MLTQIIASAVVIIVFGGIFMIVTVVRNNYMAKVDPEHCNGIAEGGCAGCSLRCDQYRNEVYKEAAKEIAHLKKKEESVEQTETK